MVASVATWLALFCYVVAVKLAVDAFLPQAIAAEDQRNAFAWPVLALVAALGAIGAALAPGTGFPAAESVLSAPRRGLLLPAAIGLAIAAVEVVFDVTTGYSRLLNAAHGIERQYTDFPSMLLVFTAFAIYVEPIYRLLPIPLLLWLISGLALRGRWQVPVFWVLAVLFSLFEPLNQASVVPGVPFAWWAFDLGLGFGFNLTQALFFRRYGFVASIAVRLGYYLLWHVLYVH
jgi:hypothetical protein